MQVEAQEAMREALNNFRQGRAADLSADEHALLWEIGSALSQGDPAQSPNEGIERAASEPVGHLHSNGDFCLERMPEAPVWWPIELYTRPQPSVDKPAEPSEKPLPPSDGHYVLATKFSDGDPGDPWALGYYAGLEFGDRHMVKDNDGKNIKAGGYRRVGRVTPEIGNWLYANRDLLERAPSKINLWGMYDWTFVNERILEAEGDAP